MLLPANLELLPSTLAERGQHLAIRQSYAPFSDGGCRMRASDAVRVGAAELLSFYSLTLIEAGSLLLKLRLIPGLRTSITISPPRPLRGAVAERAERGTGCGARGLRGNEALG
jgi:hypothetical protein